MLSQIFFSENETFNVYFVQKNEEYHITKSLKFNRDRLSFFIKINALPSIFRDFLNISKRKTIFLIIILWHDFL